MPGRLLNEKPAAQSEPASPGLCEPERSAWKKKRPRALVLATARGRFFFHAERSGSHNPGDAGSL